ncbi:chorismate mutase [Amycolatopsis jiangsuensis]|uniref:Chorismate mutase n=1 Tax=Amycolatopsis jiangsuensis TaxID=1181879 RepID=A0A840IUW0_9PSEU|nr:chorismate mutase [Amycolatopsis jiangsuensis]MBB4686491.1 chorismate mutase [Amycolatopsis jiangsuensis]
MKLRVPVLTALVLAALSLGGEAMAAPRQPAPAAAAAGRLGPLTDLVVERLFVGDEVAAAKFGTGKPIDDPAREEQELAEVRERAGALGIDPERTARFFRDQIEASKVVQRGLFARWTAHPGEAPTTRPDLAVIREELDALTTRLLDQLVATEPARDASIACRVSAAEAAVSAVVLDRLDALHRNALRTALHSLC